MFLALLAVGCRHNDVLLEDKFPTPLFGGMLSGWASVFIMLLFGREIEYIQ
jgi:hypothetical protein